MYSALITAIITTIISSATAGVLGFVCKHFRKKYLEYKKKDLDLEQRMNNLEKGMQCVLRNNIIHTHDRCVDKGYCAIYQKEAIRIEYDSYHALKGNGLVDKLYSDIMALPEELPNNNKEA